MIYLQIHQIKFYFELKLVQTFDVKKNKFPYNIDNFATFSSLIKQNIVNSIY